MIIVTARLINRRDWRSRALRELLGIPITLAASAEEEHEELAGGTPVTDETENGELPKPEDANGEQGIAVAVVTQQDRLLIVRRNNPEPGQEWQLPGGKIKDGESPDVAARRETLEETGMLVSPQKLLGDRVHPATGRRIFYVACAFHSRQFDKASDREVAEVEWCPLWLVPQRIPGGLYQIVTAYLGVPTAQASTAPAGHGEAAATDRGGRIADS
jgi:8-oxo-dGTP diphosphatase